MRFNMFSYCAKLLSVLIVTTGSVTSAATSSKNRANRDNKQAIANFDLMSGPSSERAPTAGLRQSVGSALSPDDGIGKGVSVDRTYDDAQYTEGYGRHIAHWWNGEYGTNAEVSVHFGYRAMDDTASSGAFGFSGYNMFDATVAPNGDWPRQQDQGCDLQEIDTAGWGGMPSLDIMPNGRVVTAAISHLGNGFLGDGSAYVDNMIFYQGTEFGCTYVPGLNATFIDSTVYRQHFLDQSEGYYSRNPQVVTQWDGTNTIVHLLLGEGSEGVTLSGYDYAETYYEYITFTYYRKIGDEATSGAWSAGQIIDSLLHPWASMTAAPHPYEGVAVTYTNPSYYGALLNNGNDLNVWLRESLDRGLTWQQSRAISYVDCGIFPCDPPAYASWLESQPLYSSDGDLHVIFTGAPTSADPYFDGFNWLDFNANLYHWVKSENPGGGNVFTKVANGTFPIYGCMTCTINTLHCGFGGPNAGYIANINISECDEKLYCIWNQIHERANRMPWMDAETQPAPGVLDDCALEGNRLSMANWEILMSVARLSTSSLWDVARNISDTYTPNCGLPGDPDIEGPCASDYKPSVERYGLDEAGLGLYWPTEATVDLSPGQDYSGTAFLNMMYLDDQNPGQSFHETRSNPPATYNSIKWIRLACVEPVEASEISVVPGVIAWPEWIELGQSNNLTVTVINWGNVTMNISEIGYVETSGSGWLSTSVNPTPSTPLQISAGSSWYNEETFDIIVNATGLSTTTWLDGEVWIKSDAINDDSVSIMLHLLAAADVEPVVWDTVQTHENMFDVYFFPQGECVALAIGNNGEVGRGAGTDGSVNLDYVESETECGDRSYHGIYLQSGSAFAILADDASGANAELTSSYNDPNQADVTGWDPIGTKGSISGGLSATGLYDSVYTGAFVNRDTTIAMERIYYAPRTNDPENDIINFVICYTKFYSADGTGHNHVTVGNVIDWNLPSEQWDINTSGLSSKGFVYMQGTDTTGVLSCQSNTGRFATEAFGGAYTSVEFEADECANDQDYHSVNALTQILLEDTTHYRDGTPLEPSQPNPEVWWQETAVADLNADAAAIDQAIWFTYVHDYNFGATDTLHYWTVLSTVRDGDLADLEEQVQFGHDWYTWQLRGCDIGCCEDKVGNCNLLGGDIPTIGDVSVMIDAKFITGDCWVLGQYLDACLAECDINQSGGCDPTCNDITIGDISILIDHLFITGPTLILPDCLPCN